MKAAGELLLCGVSESSETFRALKNQGGAMQGDAEGIWSQDEFVAEEADDLTILVRHLLAGAGRRPLNRHCGDLNRQSSRLKRICFKVPFTHGHEKAQRVIRRRAASWARRIDSVKDAS
jgi:hypothetical protein